MPNAKKQIQKNNLDSLMTSASKKKRGWVWLIIFFNSLLAFINLSLIFPYLDANQIKYEKIGLDGLFFVSLLVVSAALFLYSIILLFQLKKLATKVLLLIFSIHMFEWLWEFYNGFYTVWDSIIFYFDCSLGIILLSCYLLEKKKILT